jgi:phospholipid/cholesterol/gamma-HCH transport system substrate-binding protein
MRLLGQQFSERLNRRMKIQLSIFAVVGVVAASMMVFGYMRLPAMFGVGHYTVSVQLPRGGGAYAGGNVTYRGVEVGRITSVRLTDTGVDAELSLRSDVSIPADLDAQVHSVSGIGEQYIALIPRRGGGANLKDGDVIPVARASVPPDINALLNAANRSLQAIPRDNVKTVVDESYKAIGGLGPEISRFVNGSTQLAIDARANLDPLVSIIDQSQPVLDSQTKSADSIHAWAANLADITRQLQNNDESVAGLLQNGGPAAAEAKQLVDRLQPVLPTLLANLVSVGPVAVTYQPAIEQTLVLLPALVANLQATAMPSAGTKHPALNLAFNLNLNLPPPCTTGFLPAQQARPPSVQDAPDRPAGDLYCRVAQDGPFAVRGARNYPCLAAPGKRAPTAKMCESDEQYVPLNDGYYWKGDPNATLSGQAVPQLPAGAPAPAAPPPPSAAPIGTAYYDPATGRYVGPDGKLYTQADLVHDGEGKTWQDMLTPPTGP